MATRKQPTPSTVKALFAKSSNRCAFPDCDQPLIDDRNLFVGEICHIHSVKKGGPRFDAALSADELRRRENLILLCHGHHVRIDSLPAEFSAEMLREMRETHEAGAGTATFSPPPEVLSRIEGEYARYWDHLDTVTKTRQELLEVAVEIDASATVPDLATKLVAQLNHLEEILRELQSSDGRLHDDIVELLEKIGIDAKPYADLKYYDDPFAHRHHEVLNYDFANTLLRCQILFTQVQLHYFQQELLKNPGSEETADRVDRLQGELAVMASNGAYVD